MYRQKKDENKKGEKNTYIKEKDNVGVSLVGMTSHTLVETLSTKQEKLLLK